MNRHKFVTAIIVLCCGWCLVFSSDSCHGSGTVYNCSNTGLVVMPTSSDVAAGYEVLDFSHNHIENVTYMEYKYSPSNHSKLLLNDNQISIIRNNSFELLTNLVYLDLSSNMILGKELDEHMFNDLRKLKTLILERNPLRYLKKNTFNFMELPAIRSLDISHAEISTIEKGALDLPSLEALDLSWNALESFDSDAFRMMVDLMVLDMSHNRIKVLDSVPYLPEIRIWNLDNNAIENVVISDEIWQYADSLEKLTLRNNRIMQFSFMSLPFDLETLVLLDMSDNDLVCDCKMKWIAKQEIDRTNRTINIPCTYPTNHKGKNILDITEDDLKCSFPLYKILLGAGLLLLAATCITVLFFFVILPRRRSKRPYRAPQRDDTGGDYTAVYTKEDDDVTVQTPDNKRLIDQGTEFDV